MAHRLNKQPTEYRKIMHNQLEYNSGFTLIELMVTISIAAILLAMAIPSFTSTIASNRLTGNANELVTALNLARSEAIKRGIQVTVRRNISSASSQWESGWDVFVDINSDGTFSDNGVVPLCEISANGSPTEDCLLRTYSTLPGSYTLRGNTNFTDFIRYTPTGAISNSVGGSFVICNGNTVSGSKLLIVNGMGRVRIAPDADHDGIPEKGDGTEIGSCTSGF